MTKLPSEQITKTEPLTPSKELTLLMGLPYAGKSSWAKRMSRTLLAPVVCPDAIRVALHGQRFVPEAEGFVWAQAKLMVRALLMAGNEHVYLDATNLKRQYRDNWADLGVRRRIIHFAASAEECIRRATEAGDTEIIPVIERMAASIEPVVSEEGFTELVTYNAQGEYTGTQSFGVSADA